MKRAIVFGMLLAAGVVRGDETLPVAATAVRPGSMVVFAVMGRTIFPVGCWNAAEKRLDGNMSCISLNQAGDEVQLDGGERVKIGETTRMWGGGPEVDPVPAWQIDRAVAGARWGVWPPAAVARTRVAEKGKREVVGLDLDGKGFGAQLVVWEKGRKRLVNWRVLNRDGGFLGGYSR